MPRGDAACHVAGARATRFHALPSLAGWRDGGHVHDGWEQQDASERAMAVRTVDESTIGPGRSQGDRRQGGWWMAERGSGDLSLELTELANVLESARLLAECQRTRAFAEIADDRAAVRAVAATVGLVAERLRLTAARLNDDDLAAPVPRPRSARRPRPRR
jgi:hypothetical protein